MKKKIGIIIITIIIIAILIFGALYFIDHKRMEENKPVLFSTWGKDYKVTTENKKDNENQKDEETETSAEINFALTLEDNVGQDTAWCGTFQLIWNDLKNDLAKQDIIFMQEPDLQVVKNLNKETFKTEDISENSYYKVYGNPTLELKEQIEKAIKEKFNEESEILDDFSWGSNNPKDYFLYCMLKKEFEFPVAFKELEDGEFANGKYSKIKYFGLEKDAEEELRSQVEVLYYNSPSQFAVKLKTKQNDEIILARGEEGNTFQEIYNNINTNSENYEGIKKFTEKDELKIPNIDFKQKTEFTELEQKEFSFANGDVYIIEKALQTIQFELDKEGGKIKSEAGIMNKEMAIATDEIEERKFNFDDEFVIFLKENDKEKPYFAASISDITKFQ